MTKVVQEEQKDSEGEETDLHKQHYEHTLNALNFIRSELTFVPFEDIS